MEGGGSGTLRNVARHTRWHQQRQEEPQSLSLPLFSRTLDAPGSALNAGSPHREAAAQPMPLKHSANAYKQDPKNLYLPQLLLPAPKTGFSGSKQEQFFPYRSAGLNTGWRQLAPAAAQSPSPCRSAQNHPPSPVSDHILTVTGKPILVKVTEWLAKQTYLCL